MSLHQYLVSPPLAIAIVPAKPHPPPRTEKKSDPQNKDIDKEKEKGKQDEKKVEGPAPDPKANADAAKQEADGVVKDHGVLVPKHQGDGEPNTPGSMNPEPPTPAKDIVVDADPQASPSPNDTPADAKDKPQESKPKEDVVADDLKDGDTAAKAKAEAGKANAGQTKPKPDTAPKEPFIGPLPNPDSEDPEPELEPIPLRLIGPPPKYPIRTKLDLDPSQPWPPVESDPRGVYHHYAKGCHKGIIESVYIDVTKDGWMTEHWKEKTERDALAKLRGADLGKARRELEWQGKLKQRKKVPKTAGEILLCLWNLLVEAPNNELSTETFWSGFDWDDPAAQVHTKHVPVEDMNENKSIIVDGEEVEWTKDGVEQILATVGIQCVYNSDTAIDRRRTDRWPGSFGQDRAFIILGHGHFMLRLREWLEWKSKDTVGKFEVLVVSGHDRILGEMVREKRMAERKKEEIEYYKRKKAQKEAADKEKEKEKGKGSEEEKDVKKETEGDKKKEEEGKSDTSTKKVKNGKEVGKIDNGAQAKVNDEGQEGKEDKVEEGKLLVAIPVVTDGIKGEDLDEKHDQIAMLAAPGEAAAAGAQAKAQDEDQVKDKVGANEKDEKKNEKEVRDPMRDAERIAKMMGNNAGHLKMEDIQNALKVLEAASDNKDEKADKEETGLIWTWGEACERWRWANYEAGVQDVKLGGWEERDWKVFADDRGCEEFENEMGKAESLEEDVHDWSC